ncbi:MAG TPA: hypothetical protein VNE39_13000 [Planctomycetota bacterium]|nr:hypothetical protein [Planctomycetota bacterium]
MGATKIGIIAEGPIDQALLPALLERIACDRAQFRWPVSPEDATSSLRMRKRGHGGVLVAVRQIVNFLKRSSLFSYFAFFVILLDRRTKPVQDEVRKLVRESDRFVVGIAIEEIEAWWLGDRASTLAFLQLSDALPSELRYADPNYKAEQDPHPKKTLDELTQVSGAVDSTYGQGHVGIATDFARGWRDTAQLDSIEWQCPKGFGAFCRDATNEFRRSKAKAGLLFS